MKYDVTKIQEFSEKLAKWREDRGLTLEGQREGFKNNMLEELEEYIKALRLNDERGQIDALCDMCVVWLNCEWKTDWGDVILDKTSNYMSKYGVFSLIYNALDTEYPWFVRDILEIVYSKGYNPHIAMEETIKELNSRTGKWVEKDKKFIKDKGAYDYVGAEIEAQKIHNEIQFDMENGTFWRFYIDGTETIIQIKKWYKADFEKARL